MERLVGGITVSATDAVRSLVVKGLEAHEAAKSKPAPPNVAAKAIAAGTGAGLEGAAGSAVTPASPFSSLGLIPWTDGSDSTVRTQPTLGGKLTGEGEEV